METNLFNDGVRMVLEAAKAFRLGPNQRLVYTTRTGKECLCLQAGINPEQLTVCPPDYCVEYLGAGAWDGDISLRRLEAMFKISTITDLFAKKDSDE